jgi:hypothetical protein
MAFNIVLSDDELDDDGESTRRDKQAAETYSARDAINASVPLQSTSGRAAAADMKRGARITERAPEYEAGKQAIDLLDEPDANKWLSNLEMLLVNAQTRDEVIDIGGLQSVGKATANAPKHIKARISELLATNFARFPEPADAKTEDAWPGDDLEIKGEEKLAAGD